MANALTNFYDHAKAYHEIQPSASSNTTQTHHYHCCHHQVNGPSAIAVLLGIAVIAAFAGILKGCEDACGMKANANAVRQIKILNDNPEVPKDAVTQQIMQKHQVIASRRLEDGRVFLGCAATLGAAVIAEFVRGKSGYLAALMGLSLVTANVFGFRSWNIPSLTVEERQFIQQRATQNT